MPMYSNNIFKALCTVAGTPPSGNIPWSSLRWWVLTDAHRCRTVRRNPSAWPRAALPCWYRATVTSNRQCPRHRTARRPICGWDLPGCATAVALACSGCPPWCCALAAASRTCYATSSRRSSAWGQADQCRQFRRRRRKVQFRQRSVPLRKLPQPQCLVLCRWNPSAAGRHCRKRPPLDPARTLCASVSASPAWQHTWCWQHRSAASVSSSSTSGAESGSCAVPSHAAGCWTPARTCAAARRENNRQQINIRSWNFKKHFFSSFYSLFIFAVLIF